MALSVNQTANRTTRFSKPSDTNAVTIYSLPSDRNGTASIEGVVISAGGSGASATVTVNDGSTDWVVLAAKAVVANTTETYEFANLVIRPGWSVKVTVSSGNTLTFAAIIAESFRPT